MDLHRLMKAAESIYLAAPSSVARDISDMLVWATRTIMTMQKQNEYLAGTIEALTKELAKMEGDKNG